MSQFNLKIVTVNKLFFDDVVDMIIVRAKDGDMAIKSGHIGLVTALDVGKLRIYKDETILEAAISGGFLKVLKEDGITSATIVTTSGEWAQDIDLIRAQSAAENAKKALEDINNNEKSQRLNEIKLKRAINRINIAK